MSEDFCTFYIVRHGQAELNRDAIVMGQIDSPLTKLGIEQAKTIRDTLKDIQFDRIIVSNLQRAIDTALIITGTDGSTFELDPSLRERSFGNLEGKSQQELKNVRLKSNSYSKDEKWAAKLVAGMESDKELFERVSYSLKSFAQQHLGSTVLVVTHSGPIRTLLMGLGFCALDELTSGFVGNGEYVIVRMNKTQAFLTGVYSSGTIKETIE